jgi:predicted phage-related endonuclease
MEILNLQQGSAEWLAHRSTVKNASDAPAMMGESKHKTRSDLIKERATGITPEVSRDLQRRFDDGHKFEEMARPIAERIIGDELYPVTGVNGEYGASFDGLTMDERFAYEHKTLNNDIRACTCAADLPLMYRIQMEQQLMVSENTEKVLFVASKWTEDFLRNWGMEDEVHFWYEPDLALRQRIIDGWVQFDKDVAAYVPEEVKVEPVTKAAETLPVPSIVVRGEVTMSNLEEITPEFDRILGAMNTELVTDDHFAQADIDAKACREAAKNLKLTAQAVVNQIAPVSETVRTLEDYAKKFDALGLTLEKGVKDQKDSLKENAILKAKQDFAAHVAALEKEIAPLRLSTIAPNFAEAIKGVKTIATMTDRIKTALAQGRADAETEARDLRAKLGWFNHHAAEHTFLFNDLATIIRKPSDDFGLLVKTRISEHQNEQERKMEEERQRIRLEEAAKARLEEADAAHAKALAEEKAKQDEKPAVTTETTQSVIPVSVSSEFVNKDSLKGQVDVFTGEVGSYTGYQQITHVSEDTGARLKIGDINNILGFHVTAEFLGKLGHDPISKERSAVLYRECDFPLICDAIARHVLQTANSYQQKLAA